MSSPQDVSLAKAALVPQASWSLAKPASIPRPTWAPAATAFGVFFFFWGFVTSPVLLGAGLLILIASLVGWIGEMRRDD